MRIKRAESLFLFLNITHFFPGPHAKQHYYYPTCWVISQLPASHLCISISPEVVTHCGPFVVPTDLYTALEASAASNQPDCTIGASYVNKTQNVINMHGLQFGLLIPGHILLAVIHTGNSTLEYALYFRSTIYKNTIIILRCMHHIYSVYYYIYYLSQTN